MNVNPFFEEELLVTLSLESEGNAVKIDAGNIQKFSLELRSYGFNANIQFSGHKNKDLDELFQSKQPMSVTLTLNPGKPDPKMSLPLLEIEGIVTKKFFKRVDYLGDSSNRSKDEAIRHYEIVICDNAQATWGEHYPVNIYVNESMKEMIEAQKNPKINLKYDFAPLENKRPIIAFCLAYNNAVPEQEQVSFYSFLTWYLHHEGGILSYDYKTNSYVITGEKSQLTNLPFGISEWWVAPPTGIFPQTPRYSTKIVKHSPDSLDPENKENEIGFSSVRRDLISSKYYQALPEQAGRKVKSPWNTQMPEVELEVMNFEDEFHLDKLLPGRFVSFVRGRGLKDALIPGSAEESWSQDSFYKGRAFRCRYLYIEAHNLSVSESTPKKAETYQLYVKSLLEQKDEAYIDRPLFRAPTYPFSIQGKVFSDVGDTEQTTYKISENEDVSQGLYLVTAPLAENKKIPVPFAPDFMTGQHYFPLCKDERVLLSVYLHTAKIQRVLDWQPLARLPSSVQGNQIVFSSNGKDKYAVMKHEFAEGKNSTITIKQATSGGQTQTVEMRDKDLKITVEEQGKKTVTIHLNSSSGLTLQVDDKGSGASQEVALNGEGMTTTCKNSAETSTITQKPDSITIKCKEFNVTSNLINLIAIESMTQVGADINVLAPSYIVKAKLADIRAKTVKLG